MTAKGHIATPHELELVKAWHAAHPERVRAHKKAWKDKNPGYAHAYKTGAFKLKKQAKQEAEAGRPRPDRCEICLNPPSGNGSANKSLHFDHCHTTGKFRGWLCSRCNLTLGKVEDSPELLEKLAAYLRASHAS